jgi:hypothetical protein
MTAGSLEEAGVSGGDDRGVVVAVFIEVTAWADSCERGAVRGVADGGALEGIGVVGNDIGVGVEEWAGAEGASGGFGYRVSGMISSNGAGI